MKQYSIIYADPPWWYSSRISRGAGTRTKSGNGALGHYDLMKDKDLLAMATQIKAITAKRAHLLMWATYPRLDFAVQLLKEWGFKYATVLFTWIKVTKEGLRLFSNFLISWEDFSKKLPKKGLGSYTASGPEIVLIGRKGKALPKLKKLAQHVYLLPVREHSRKPDEIRKAIEEIWGDVPRVELFCRHPAPGWDVIGDEIDGRDIREVLQEVE